MQRLLPVIVVWGAVFAVGLALITTSLALAGHSPFHVLASTVSALAGLRPLASSLEDVAPLLLCALATSVAFRAGVLNIGGEGQYLLGVAAMVAVGTVVRPPGPGWFVVVVGMLAAMAAGAVWASLAGSLQRWRGVNEVLSTILLNFIAVALVSWLVEGPLGDPKTTAPQSAILASDLRLPRLVALTKFHLGILLAIGIAVLIWIAERRTRLGFELGLVGLNAEAGRAFGMPVERHRMRAFAIGGALAGLAGAFQLAGVTYQLTGGTRSFGYLGVAVALLGGLHPLGIVVAACFFALLDGGGRTMERLHGVPRDLTDVIKGAVLLTALVGTAVLAARQRRQVVDA